MQPRSKLWRRLTVDRPQLKVKAADSCAECGVFPFVDWHSEFKDHCVWHDARYVDREENTLPPDYTREKVDEMFFRQCLFTAQHNARLLEKAAIYFILVRRFGGLVW